MHQNAGNMPQIFLGNTLQFLYKNDNFWNYFKKHLIKIYTNTHQIAPFLKIFSEDLLNPVMYSHLLFFKKKYDTKGPLFPIFKRSSSIHKNNPALVASIVLEKIYFHGICALSKKIHLFSCVHVCSLKKPHFTR